MQFFIEKKMKETNKKNVLSRAILDVGQLGSCAMAIFLPARILFSIQGAWPTSHQIRCILQLAIGLPALRSFPPANMMCPWISVALLL